jgi:hypothetical protein
MNLESAINIEDLHKIAKTRGVDAGENVVALGAHLLHEGQAVNLASEEKISDAKF